MKQKVQCVVLILLCGAFAFAQDIAIPPITPLSPSISICGNGTFTVTVTNETDTEITGVTINALVVANAGSHTAASDYVYVSSTPSGSTSPPMVTWDSITLAEMGSTGDSWTGTVTVSPTCDAIIGRVLLVTVSYPDPLDPTSTVSVEAESGSITVLKPSLIIELSPLGQLKGVGETAEWDVTITNVGVGDLTDINLTAILQAGFINPTSTSGSFVGNSLTGTIAGPIVPGGSLVWTHITAEVNSCTELGLIVTGTYGDCGPGGAPCGNGSATDGVTLKYLTPNLAYTMTPEPLTVPYCGSAEVTVNMTNSDPAGGTAGAIRALYMGIILPGELDIDTPPANYTAGGPNGVTGEFFIGDVPRNGTSNFTFNIKWKDSCAPVQCDSIIFVPRFDDDCGAEFTPPIQELHIGDPPTVPYFTILKSGPTNLNQGQSGDYDIVVTFYAPEGTSTTADILDDVPDAFAATAPSGTGTVVGQLVSWMDETFLVPGGQDHVTRTFEVTFTPDYLSSDCDDDFINRASVINADPVCSMCPVNPAAAVLNLVGSPILEVAKTGPNSLYVNGAVATYTITVSYDGPLTGGVTPPARVVDYVPVGVNVTTPALPVPGVYDPVAHTITWDLPADTLVAGGDLALTYTMALDTTASGYDPCNCGTTFVNRVTAALAGAPVFASCDVQDTLEIAVECDDETQAPFTAIKSADVTAQELCGCITYTNTFTFSDNLTNWSDVTIRENANNGQTFTGGALTGSAEFHLTRGASTYTDTVSLTVGSDFSLGSISGFPVKSPPGDPYDIHAGDVLTVSYTLCLPSGLPSPTTFVDWTDIHVVGHATLCGSGDDYYHEGVWVTAQRRIPNLTITSLCHDAGPSNPCSNVINKCEDAAFRINLSQTNPSYNVVITINTNGNYTYDETQTPTYSGIMSPFAGTTPVASGNTLTWTFGAISGSGAGYIEFLVHKDCTSATRIDAGATADDLCGNPAVSVTSFFEARRVWEGKIIIKKTPEVIYSKDKLPTWVIYVTNRGSGTAYNISVMDTLNAGIEYSSYTVADVDPGATVTFDNPDNRNLTWVVSSIDPGRTVQITLVGSVVSCSDLTNAVHAQWGCGVGADYICETTDEQGSQVVLLPTRVIITGHSSTRVDMCGSGPSDATVTYRFKNVGGSNAYNLVVTEELPDGLSYVSGSRSESCGGPACSGVVFTESAGTLTWEFTDAAGMAPGQEYTVSFGLDSGADCTFQDGDTIDLNLNYRTPCESAGEPATNGLVVRTYHPNITITKTSSPDPLYLQPGDTATWEIRLENTGDYVATDVRLWDDFPIALINEATITIDGGLSGSGSTADPWIVPNMNPGERRTYTISAIVDGCGEGVNTAHVSWGNCACAEESADSNTTTIITAPDMDISSVVADVTNCGGTISVQVRNIGVASFGISLEDQIPSGFVYVPGSTTITSSRGRSFGSTEPSVTGSGTVLTWSETNFDGYIGYNDSAGETITITFGITYGTDAGGNPDCTDIGGNNSVTLTYEDSPTCGGGSTTVGPVVTSVRPTTPSFTAALNPTLQVRGPGERAGWTITITDTGGATETGSVTITEVLGQDFNMTTIPAAQLIITTAHGNVTGTISDHTITWSNVTLNAGETITRLLQVFTEATGNEGDLSNTLTVSGRCAGGCLYATASAEAYVGYTNITKTIVPTTATIGETVPVSITANYYGEGTAYTNVVIRDTLPAGFTYVAGTAYLNGVLRAPDSTTGGVLTFNLGNVPGGYGTQSFVITFNMLVMNTAANNNGNNKTNTANTTYTIDGRNFTDSASDTIRITEPVLDITKNENDADNVVVAGQSLIYTVTVYHTGASTVDAHDIVVTDVLPTGLTVNSASISGGGTYNSGTRTITWTFDPLTRGAPDNGTRSFTYTAVVDSGVVPNQVLTNNTHLTWTSLHDATAGEHPERRTGSGTGPNDYLDNATNTVTVDTTSSITKVLNTTPDVTIGSEAGYTITVNLPRATIPSLIITDTMGEGLRFVSGAGDAIVTLPNGTSAAIDPVVSGGNGGSGSTTLSWNLGSVDASGVANPAVTITFSAVVANTVQNQDTDTITNTASYVFTGAGGFTGSGSASSANLNVHEPLLTVLKAHALVAPSTLYEAGATIEYTLTVTNGGSSTAHNVVVTDVTPVKMTGLTWTAGGNSHTISGNTITYNIASIAVGDSVTLQYQVTLGNNINPNELLTNSVTTTWESLPSGSERRTGTGTNPPNDYIASTTDSVRVNNAATIAKTPDTVRNVTILSTAPYTITVTLPRATIPALTIVENLGEGLIYSSGTARITYPANPGSPVAVEPVWTGPHDGTAASTLSWDFANLDATSGNPLTITFDAIVADIDQNKDGDDIANSASATGATLDFGGGSHTGTDSSADVHLMIPAFTTSKGLVSIIGSDGTDRTAAGVIEPGDAVTYTFTINNVGSGDAENVVITDTLPSYFTYESASVAPGQVDPTGRIITWDGRPATITIAGNGSMTITVTARVSHDLVKDPAGYTNTVTVIGNDILGNQVPADNSGHVSLDNDLDDTSTYIINTAHIPAFIVDKTILGVYDAAGNPVPDPGTIGPGEHADYRVVVTNVGDGTAYDVHVSDTLPTGLQYGDPAPPLSSPPNAWTEASWGGNTYNGNPTGVTGTIQWNAASFAGAPAGIVLPGGGTLTLTYRVYANSDIVHLSTITNHAQTWGTDGSGAAVVKDRHVDIPADTNPTDDDSTTLIGRLPFLVTDKIVTAIDGNTENTTVAVVDSVIDYETTFTNVGLSDAFVVNLYDTMPIGFEYVAGSANLGEPVIVDRELSWEVAATIATGDTLTLTFQLRVTDSTTGGQAINHVWAEGEDGNAQPIIKDGHVWCTEDTDALDAHDAEVFVDIPSLPLILKKSVTPRSIGSGGVVHYTVSFTNNRKISFYDATITDTLPSGFRYLPGTTLVNGTPSADPVGNNPYTFAIGTVPPESVTTLDYYVLVTHAARHGANVNTAVLNAHDGAGRPISLTDKETVIVKGEGFVDFETFPYPPRIARPASPVERPSRPVEEERPRPECCLHVAMIPVRSQAFGETAPGRPEIYYQTDIAMYAATELLVTEKRMTPWLEVQGFDPERKYLMTGLYNRMITKLGEYAQYNLGNVVMESLLGIPLDYAPGVLEKARRSGTSPERAGSDMIKDLAVRAGLSKAPDIQPIFLEYFGSYPYLHERIADDKLAWEERLMDKNIMPAALGFTLLREANQIELYLASSDPTERFFGLLMLTQAVEKTRSISMDLAKSAEFSPPVKYLPHFSRIEVDKAGSRLVWRTTDKTSTLYDHASVLWGLAKLRSVALHSADPDVRALLPQITERMNEVYRAIEAIHYNKEGKTFVSIHSPEKTDDTKSVYAKDLAFTILALRSVLFDNRDLSINTIDPKRKIVEIADFMIEKLMGDDGGIYASYNYADGCPVVGVKRTLVDNALAVRALLTAYNVTEDRKYRKAALDVYSFMVKELWYEDLMIFIDEEDPDYEVVLTPQSIGALIGALRDLVLYGDPAMRHDYLDRMSYTTDRVLDQSQLQLYENRFFPWHAPITIVPKDPNGRSYIKPIITTIRDKGISHDLAPILVRKMVLNITPAGAISTGNEEAVSDWNKWKADLRYEVPDIIASAVIDDTFVTDEGMYFTTLTRDYQANLNKDLPAFNPYHTDPGIQVYGAFVGGEVSRYNVENLTLNSGMGIGLSESELVRRLAKKAGKNPEKYLTDYVKGRVPKEGTEDDILGRLVERVKDAVGLSGGGRFSDIIYLEYASGKPFYTDGISSGWDEKTFDEKLTVSSMSSSMVRQLMVILDNNGRDDLSKSERFVNDVITMSVAAKRVALGEIIRNAKKDKIAGVPHSFAMVADEKEKRSVVKIAEKNSTLFDDAFSIWAMALFIDARQEGLFDGYRAVMTDTNDDEAVLAALIDALIAHHYSAEYGTLVTGSVNTVEVSKVLDMLTRAAEVMDNGPAKEKLMGLIVKQADFIIARLATDTGFAPMVGLGGEKIPTDLCEFETLGTNVFPILALVRTSEVTGDQKYLRQALVYFDRFDESKWDQAIGLYLSSGTIYKAADYSKLELKYNNQELIAAVLLISKLQPHLSGERKILSAYHMTTFMNRIMEIASVERYPGNEESNETIFSPEIIRSVKIILAESKGVGKPGDVFTNRIVINNDCYDSVARALSRIRIEQTLPDGFHYVPGSTRFNGSPGPDPIGRKTLNWYYPLLNGKNRLVIDYQVVADPKIAEGSYTSSLDVLSFSGYGGEYILCQDRDIASTTLIVADPLAGDVEKSCVPCGIGRRAFAR